LFRCDGVIGQLTEAWNNTLFAALKNAGGKAYSNYAVGEITVYHLFERKFITSGKIINLVE